MTMHKWNANEVENDIVVRQCRNCNRVEATHLVCSECGQKVPYELGNTYTWNILSHGDGSCQKVNYKWQVTSNSAAIIGETDGY